MRLLKKVALLTIVAMLGGFVALLGASPVRADDAPIDGAGSTWSQIAVDQWRADVARQGLVVNYQGVGSTAGRAAYYQAQVDFAVSEIPFQAALRDRQGNVAADETQQAASRPYAYMPIVAGGTAFMYNLKVAGQRLTDLKLSPSTLAKIFTGQITMWNDPVIVAENPGKAMPATRVKPVIRSDGSGTSAQFTAYMASQSPSDWNVLCGNAGLGSGCPATSLYPDYPGSGFAAQQFSDGVANFVAAPYNEGAITYVEYGYAKERGFPVASIRNASGNYAQPSAVNVSVALQGARINSDGTQVLEGVYTNSDQRAYPVSSYSYMIVPISEVNPFNAGKGASLSKFILYFLCAGQQKAEQLGYAPLPKNLVQFGFDAVAQIPGHVEIPSIDSCTNPTITGDFLVAKAPSTTAAPETTLPPSGGSGGSGGSGSSGSSTGGNVAATTTVPGATATTVAASESGENDTGTDVVLAEGAPGSPALVTVPGVAVATSLQIETTGSSIDPWVYVVLVILLLAIVILPPVISGKLRPSVKR
ncbi:MAG: phosphate ABC transporter substrate-binding protein PstS [Ilumatobacteraceae bacterium]